MLWHESELGHWKKDRMIPTSPHGPSAVRLNCPFCELTQVLLTTIVIRQFTISSFSIGSPSLTLLVLTIAPRNRCIVDLYTTCSGGIDGLSIFPEIGDERDGTRPLPEEAH
jgi:hypothetical protein